MGQENPFYPQRESLLALFKVVVPAVCYIHTLPKA